MHDIYQHRNVYEVVSKQKAGGVERERSGRSEDALEGDGFLRTNQ